MIPRDGHVSLPAVLILCVALVVVGEAIAVAGEVVQGEEAGGGEINTLT